MEISVLARQALLCGHIIAFALAFATILNEDARLLRAKRIDSASVLASAKSVKWLLLALWATGVPMVLMDVGTNVFLLTDRPKLLAKLIVVGVLTLNGILLHLVVFPMITRKPKNFDKAATLAATVGAVSTASWLYAFFVGASRVVAPYFTLHDFAVLYLWVLAIAVAVAILVVRDRLERSLKISYSTNTPGNQEFGVSVALLEAEIARLALTDIQRRLRTQNSARQPSARELSSVGVRNRTAVASGRRAARWRA